MKRISNKRDPSPAKPGSRGFTLLEVVVAMALTAALLTILLVGMRVAANALDAGDRKLAKLDRSLAIVQVVERQVEGAAPRFVMVKQDQAMARQLTFQGDAREVRFLTNESLVGDPAHARWVAAYRVVDVADGQQQLQTSETPVMDDDQLAAALAGGAARAGATEALGDPAQKIVLSYLRPSTAGKPEEWEEEWKPEEPELPMGIRIQVWRGTYAGALTFAIPVRKVEAK